MAQLDETFYNDNELLEVKMPLNMPYITGSNAFEGVDGQLVYGGVHYNYVKRKVSRDTLYILCLPRVTKTPLCDAKAAYGKEANDRSLDKKTSETAKKASLTTEYTFNKDPYKISTISQATIINPEAVPAVYTLSGAPTGCINSFVKGTYTVGANLSSLQTIILNVDAITPGNY